jgi:UDP-N-acetyl-D-galactosamine dehydrogenase
MTHLPTFTDFQNRSEKIVVVGLGYVGLPLAVHLGRHFSTLGFDIKTGRVEQLQQGFDETLEMSREDLAGSPVVYTSDEASLSSCRLIIVAVPTPIDKARIPDLGPVRSASTLVGRRMTRGTCVVFESTVYPGVTEEVCVPILERESGLALGRDFTVGYSPERINPGDKVHTLESITKIVSGCDIATRDLLARIYGTVVKAGIYEASSIRVAEAAKVIENTQRDINIALMNELAIIFNRMDIDTIEVIEAASTKWNFLPFRPGLVGGHCIGVDPYYLTYKAESSATTRNHPRRATDQRRHGKVYRRKYVKDAHRFGQTVRNARVAVLGLTFKEDVPDIRNTRWWTSSANWKAMASRSLSMTPWPTPSNWNATFGIA